MPKYKKLHDQLMNLQALNKELNIVLEALNKRDQKQKKYYQKHDPKNTHLKKTKATKTHLSLHQSLTSLTEEFDMVVPPIEFLEKWTSKYLKHIKK
jgi:hypothetical protein